MKKPLGKKGKKPKAIKEDSKQDVIFAGHLIEDITAYEALLPSSEKESLSDEKVLDILEAIKKIKSKSETFSTAFRSKYDSVRFDKIQSLCKAFLRKGNENPRYRYSFLLKELTASRAELYKSVQG